MNTALNMQVISLEQFREKTRQGGNAYTQGERALSMNELEDKLNISRSSINRMRKAGTFPQEQKFGVRSVRWPESVIDAWMKSRGGQNHV